MLPTTTATSPENREHNQYLLIRNSMRRLFPLSDVARWTYAEYIQHRKDILKDEQDRLAAKLAQKEKEATLNLQPIMPAFRDKKIPEFYGPLLYGASRGAVLCEPTIWCQGWEQGKEEIAPWPTWQEMKWEGDDRAKTHVGRFLPLPREPGPEGLHWQQLSRLPQYPFDEVARIPTLEDTHLPVDEVDFEAGAELIGMALLKTVMDSNKL
ncbi:hypothetical protein K469DRAFT_736593 [Zopfia rhizophila CBS 207.26]|uniref:Uncharacterized protein n=1 Tax=Zopfia rhizophila CBS 207.26 TaxID=1314779 RepID=A0A6A6EGR6_9PEZI|nr:hypothetical protein K469DRAFT_736593 [Zopfia rhizophila CBS 207.26]